MTNRIRNIIIAGVAAMAVAAPVADLTISTDTADASVVVSPSASSVSTVNAANTINMMSMTAQQDGDEQMGDTEGYLLGGLVLIIFLLFAWSIVRPELGRAADTSKK